MENILKLREVLRPFRLSAGIISGQFLRQPPQKHGFLCLRYPIFFQFLLEENPSFKKHSLEDFTVEVLDQITALDIEEYQEYLKVYKNGDKLETNGERGLKRKISALRSFYAYYYKREMIHTNPTVWLDIPKVHQKSIIRLDADEVAMLLTILNTAATSSLARKRMYYEKTKERDLALVTLLLGTGIRVSECVGLDVEDIDFKNNGIKVTRKGGNEMIVYFGPEVEKALKDYLAVREGSLPWPVTNTRSSTLPSAGGWACRQ